MTSSASGSAASSRSSAAGSVKVGVPPPRKIVSSRGASELALELELREQRVDVARVVAAPADGGDEVAVAAAVRAERQVDVEMPRAAHADATRLGRRTSSPPQFGQTLASSSPHATQNVHSCEQIDAPLRRERGPSPHRSHDRPLLERHQLFPSCSGSAPRGTPPAAPRPRRPASSASCPPSASRAACACARCRRRSTSRSRPCASP